MKVIADTNVLIRMIVDDDEDQSIRAVELLEQASTVIVSLQSLCELVWVLRSRYSVERSDLVGVIQALLDTRNMVFNRPAVEAGLAILNAGGDFADGIIAYDGFWQGADVFVSFDKKAVSILTKQGKAARLL